MFFGHLPEIIALIFLGLLIFGPQKMIEMGAALGKAVRELREATKDMSWQELTGMGSATETPRQTAMSKLSQFSQAISANKAPSVPANVAASTSRVVGAAPEPAAPSGVSAEAVGDSAEDAVE